MTNPPLSKGKKVDIYAAGSCFCSVCVSESMSKKEIERTVNLKNPAGIERNSKWKISKGNFLDGTKNPHSCEETDGKNHYLLTCEL